MINSIATYKSNRVSYLPMMFMVLLGFAIGFIASMVLGNINKIDSSLATFINNDNNNNNNKNNNHADMGTAIVNSGVGPAGITLIDYLPPNHDSQQHEQTKIELWHQYIALNESSKVTSNQGNDGGAWNWCGHIIDYGPNFDRGYISFIANVLQPNSALEFGSGIGLYINTLYKYRAQNKHHSKHGYFIGIEPESMLDAKIYQKLSTNTINTIMNTFKNNIDDNDNDQSMNQAMIDDNSLKSQALQLAIDVIQVNQSVLDTIPKFDVVYSSEVLEHIPLKFHDKILDFLVSKTEKFMVFGAARSTQGGKGHLRESMRNKPYWIEQLTEKRNMILLPKLTDRLAKSCYNAWDKAKNSFIMIHPDYYDKLKKEMESFNINGDIDKMLSDQDNVYDLYPQFQQRVENIRSKHEICDAVPGRRILSTHL